MSTLPNHAQLELTGVFDRNPERAQRFSEFHRVRRYESLEQLLNDPSVHLVANLTNPKNHFEVSMAAMRAGKHVYSEKPLAMNLADAQALADYATAHKLLLAGAPCNVLGESAQTMWKLLRAQTIGTPRLVYAEIDDPGPSSMSSKWAARSNMPATGWVCWRRSLGPLSALPRFRTC